MRCYICDKDLTELEIQLKPDGKGYEPCTTCLEIIMDAAYCDGFVKEEPLDDQELEEEFGNGAVEILSLHTHISEMTRLDDEFGLYDDS